MLGMSESQKAKQGSKATWVECVCMMRVWEKLMLLLLPIERNIIVNEQKGERVRVEKECVKVKDCYLGEGGSQGL